MFSFKIQNLNLFFYYTQLIVCVECRVLITGDCSISRVHAKVFTQADGTVYVTDLSKYGTSVNNNKLNKDQRYQLKEGDLIKFGNQPNKSEFRLMSANNVCTLLAYDFVYRLVRLVEELIFCCSNMNANQKMEVKRSAIKLGIYSCLQEYTIIYTLDVCNHRCCHC